jgi:hypothetical protein
MHRTHEQVSQKLQTAPNPVRARSIESQAILSRKWDRSPRRIRRLCDGGHSRGTGTLSSLGGLKRDQDDYGEAERYFASGVVLACGVGSRRQADHGRLRQIEQGSSADRRSILGAKCRPSTWAPFVLVGEGG